MFEKFSITPCYVVDYPVATGKTSDSVGVGGDLPTEYALDGTTFAVIGKDRRLHLAAVTGLG